jgi:hypothetical protein
MDLLGTWLTTGASHPGSEAGRSKRDLDDLAARAAYWCALVLRYGTMTSTYATRAAGSVLMPGQHRLALMLYGSSLAERHTARAALRTSIDAYAGALKARGLTSDDAIRATLAITREPCVAANDMQRWGVLIPALRADITRWCGEAYASSTPGDGARALSARLARADR